jgi:Acetyltransferase (GNAT) family
MLAQMSIDPGWPPDYAKSGDLAEWLHRPATLGQWVAVDESEAIVGHVGLGALRPGPIADLVCAALPCGCDDLAEICRIVVDPRARMRGLAGLLTRRAMRASIEGGRVPIATVLDSRGSWLEMMLATGWKNVGKTEARRAHGDLFVLAPPQRFIDLVLG